MKKISAIKLIEKKSRFYSYLYDIDKESEIETIIKIHRKKYKKANHHCYGLYIKSKNKNIEVSKDDGEVGHPGKALLEILKKHNLNHHALVVSRIFGGIKLGVGGVTRAFRESGESTIIQYKNK
jgi:putative IMPACT (imprinted ancient) family translation regulator